MSTKSREVIWVGRIAGAKIHAKHAREVATKAVREADRAESRASIPLDAIRRPWDTPTWKLEASLKCQSCRTPRSGAYDQVDRDAANLALQVGPPTGGLEPAFEVHGRAPLFGT
jgi:hypothetical protein